MVTAKKGPAQEEPQTLQNTLLGAAKWPQGGILLSWGSSWAGFLFGGDHFLTICLVYVLRQPFKYISCDIDNIWPVGGQWQHKVCLLEF